MIVLLAAPALACGPFLSDVMFTTNTRPDADLSSFVAGNVGIVDPGWYDVYQVVAWRWLSGNPLDAAEEEQARQAWSPEGTRPEEALWPALQRWSEARRTLGRAGIEVNPWRSSEDVYDSWLVCNPDAFRTAADTLVARTATWGAGSPWVESWLEAQDAVFAACADPGAPAPRPVSKEAPPLLAADRAYQVAAWRLYTGDLAGAERDFLAIAGDERSPWRGWGTYLAGRAALRAGDWDRADALLGKVTGPLARSAEDLRGYRGPRRGLDVDAARPWRDQLAPRLEAKGGLRAHVLVDFSIAMDVVRGVSGRPGSMDSYDREEPGRADPLVDWIVTTRIPATSSLAADARAHAEERWRATGSNAWLVAALQRAHTPDLLAAAAAVPESDPAWVTLAWARAEAFAPAQRRDLLDRVLARPMPRPARNRVATARAAVATSLHDWLAHALLLPVAVTDALSEDELADAPVPADLDHPTLDAAVARTLALGAPQSVLEAAIDDPAAASQRDRLALAAWTRALVLGDDAAIRRLTPRVPLDVAGVLDAPTPEERRFRAALAALRQPVASPVPRAGLDRRVGPTEIDDFRDNWWADLAFEGDPPFAPFLTEAERAAARAEASRLVAAGGPVMALGRIVLDHVKARPDDPLAPEALHRVVRAGRFVGTGDGPTSKAAFTALHKGWPDSAWAKKTPYWYE